MKIKKLNEKLHIAVTKEDGNKIENLLNQGAEINSYNGDEHFTPLIRAVQRGNLSIVKLLIEKEADISATSIDGMTPIAWAVKEKKFDIAKFLLSCSDSKKNYLVNLKKDNEGMTPLAWAAKNGDLKMLKLLLEKGRGIVNVEDNYNRTPLMFAIDRGHLLVVKELLYNRADIEHKDINGLTTLLRAVEYGRVRIVDLLLHKAKSFLDEYNKFQVFIEAKDKDGCTALLLAIKKGHIEIVESLLYYGADVDAKDYNDYTAFLLATKDETGKISELLNKAMDRERNNLIHEGELKKENTDTNIHNTSIFQKVITWLKKSIKAIKSIFKFILTPIIKLFGYESKFSEDVIAPKNKTKTPDQAEQTKPFLSKLSECKESKSNTELPSSSSSNSELNINFKSVNLEKVNTFDNKR